MTINGERLVPRYYDDNQLQEHIKKAVSLTEKRFSNSKEQAGTRKINAEAEKLEAESRLLRAQALVTEARASHDRNILELQTEQIGLQVDELRQKRAQVQAATTVLTPEQHANVGAGGGDDSSEETLANHHPVTNFF